MTGAPPSSRSPSLAWALLVPAALLVRRAPPPPARRTECRQAGAGGKHDGRPGAALAAVHRAGGDVLRLLRDAFRPDLPHRQLRHRLRARARRAAVTIYSIEGLAGLFGRLLFGLAGDRFGAKPT